MDSVKSRASRGPESLQESSQSGWEEVPVYEESGWTEVPLNAEAKASDGWEEVPVAPQSVAKDGPGFLDYVKMAPDIAKAVWEDFKSRPGLLSREKVGS